MTAVQGSKIHLRPATAADQSTITAIVRAAHINPMGLHWERFLLADADGQIVGTGQIKPHGDGSLELASIAVIPARQGQQIGSLLVRALITQHLARTSAALYLMCEGHLETYYTRFGFQRIPRSEMPRYFQRMVTLAALVAGAVRLLRPNQKITLAVMRYEP
jgi:N-acetylglutamate synthase-like GNAT family acetyltransferase